MLEFLTFLCTLIVISVPVLWAAWFIWQDMRHRRKVESIMRRLGIEE